MADRRKIKKRKDEESHSHEKSDKASKDEIRLAKWMKANITQKKTKFANHVVEYFTGSKAIDAIMESEWAKPKNPEGDPFFRSRTDVVIFLDIMLRHKMFHRAKKVPVSEEELKAKLKNRKEKKGGGDTGDEKKKKEEVGDVGEGKRKKKKGEDKELAEKSQFKKKIRLEMHYQQVFTDGLDAYVWLYDPMPFYYWIIGFFVVIGSIGICLFPLWPPSVRMGVQYLSIAGACFIAFIIVLAILRLIVFCLVWMVTFGKFHLWLFPNLTEDVGFFASFWPLYQYEFKTDGKSKKSKSSKNKKDKQSDDEEDEEEEDEEEEEEEGEELSEEEKQKEEKEDSDRSNGTREKEESDTDSEPSSSQQSQVGKDFEIVEKEEAIPS